MDSFKSICVINPYLIVPIYVQMVILGDLKMQQSMQTSLIILMQSTPQQLHSYSSWMAIINPSKTMNIVNVVLNFNHHSHTKTLFFFGSKHQYFDKQKASVDVVCFVVPS